jgi:hypothetical protein
VAAEAQLGLEGGLTPPRSLTGLDGPVWGVDPSSLRMAFGALLPEYALAVPPFEPARVMRTAEPTVVWSTVSLPRKLEGAWWFTLSYRAIVDRVDELRCAWGVPALVLVEEPFASGQARVHPTSNRMLGVLLAALGHVLGQAVRVELVHSNTWKLLAMGKGNGHAKPPAYLEWAREQADYTGELEDEAAAIGIATAAGVKLMARRNG